MNNVSPFIKALPYIRRFFGKTIVVKCGGAAMTNTEDMQNMMQDIALLYFCGIRPVIIHGGGPEISAMCERLDIPVQFANGQRMTDTDTLEIAQMVLLGKTNRNLVNALNQFGIKTIGISGHDAAFLQAEKIDSEHDLGFVGQIVSVDTHLIDTLLTASFMPVIAPIGVDAQGQAYNINADIAAGAIASHLGAEKLIMLSDVTGLYADLNDPSTRIHKLTTREAQALIDHKKISGGMIPKLESCIHAVKQGVSCAHMISGKLEHGLLTEILSDNSTGTVITL